MNELPESIVCSDPTVVRPFLCDLREAWDGANVEWALLSGWENLPDYVRHDLDVIVSPQCYRAAVSVLKDVAGKNGWRSFGIFREGGEYSSFYFVKHIERLNEEAYIQFDLFKSYRRHNVRVLDIQLALSRRCKEENGFWHVPVGWRGAFLIIKEMLANGKVEGELRHRQIKESVATDRDAFLQTLRAFGGEVLAEKTLNAVDGGDLLFKSLAPIYSRVYRKLVLKSPFAFVCGFIQYVVGCLFPFKRLFIAFIGPDGCGKTTIADAVERQFYKHPFASVWRVKSGFGPLPRVRDIIASVKRLLTGKKVEFAKGPEAGTKGMGMVKPQSVCKAMFYVAYYGFNQILGWSRFLRFSPNLPALVIADRYYYDYYYQLGYSRCPKWFVRLIAMFIPKPDMLFVLDRDAQDIYEKKPELTIDEIRREQDMIAKYLSNSNMMRIIDARKGVEGTVAQVTAAVKEWLSDTGSICA